MHEISTKHSFVKINRSYVHLVQYGNGERILKSSIDSPSTPADRSLNRSPDISVADASHDHKVGGNEGKQLVIFLPGNPGILGVYHDYLVLLYKTICNKTSMHHRCDNDNPILLAMSHNNFDLPEDHGDGHEQMASRVIIEDSDMNFIEQSIAKSKRDPNDIELQVLNKLVILKQLLRWNLEDCQVIFVGHSIGCYIILRLLQDGLIASIHQGSILIHPALENLELTEKGRYFSRLFALKVDYLLRSLSFLADLLIPKSTWIELTKRFVCSQELVEASSEVVLEAVTRIGSPNQLYAMIQMAKSEFANIKNIDHNSLIKPHVDRLRLIYAKEDHWVNAENRKELLRDYPRLQIDEQPTMHAFVMEPTTVIDYALKVGMLIQELSD